MEMICSTLITADVNPDHRTKPGNDTTDRIFLLSIKEVMNYFGSEAARQCKVTDYAISKGAYAFNGLCRWWLRTPGKNSKHASLVDRNGSILLSGHFVYNNGGSAYPYGFDSYLGGNGVRPAMWISIE